MDLTTEQVAALATDASSAAAGRKLADPTTWRNLGRSAAALWGECQGTALYQVRIAADDLVAKCSCPSRKFPCKHSLGLLFLAAEHPRALPETTPPEWVSDWLSRRSKSAERKTKQAATTSRSADPAAHARRAERRLERVVEGLGALDMWMRDWVRRGLAGLANEGQQPWETQAARLVDAQAPAIATRVRRLAEVPGSRSDWPQQLLLELGRLSLLTHAFRRIDALEQPLQADVRQLLGWTLSQEEVVAAGDVVRDDWVVLGTWVDEDIRLRVQRNWLRGVTSSRSALVLQFSAAGAPFAETFVPGTSAPAELAFWPSAHPQRAMVVARHGAASPWNGSLPGYATIAAFLEMVADAMARQPWLERFGCSLRDVTPALDGDDWYVVDSAGDALPLKGKSHWRLLAESGSAAVDVAGEWDGERLLLLGATCAGGYQVHWPPSSQ